MNVGRIIIFASIAALTGGVGCSPNGSTSSVAPAELAKQRVQFVLHEEPPNAMGVIELRELLGGESADSDPNQHGTDGGPADHDASQDDHGHIGGDGDHADGDQHAHADEQATPDEAIPSPQGRANVAVVGQVGGASPGQHVDAEFPFEKGQAAFTISDPSHAADADHRGDDHAHGDAHDDCPFCNAKAVEAQAIVQFVDDAGQTISIDARELFELKGDEIVVVTGEARLVAGQLMVNADGIFVRR